MKQDFFLIDIPVFIPQYDSEMKYGWNKYKENLWDLLSNTTSGYCMYCYDAIVINNKKRGQIEHGIEQNNSKARLSDCVPNLGIACEICNDSYKRRGEGKRKLPKDMIEEFEKGECIGYDCKQMCNKFLKIREEYVSKGRIILQPFGVTNKDTGHELRLQYDLLKCKYVPCHTYYEYSKEELDFIKAHIELFGLNSSERKNYEVGKYCKNVVNYRSLMPDIKYNNLVVELFREKLMKIELEKAIKICEIAYNSAFYKLAT